MHISEFETFEQFRDYVEDKYTTTGYWTTGGVTGGDCWGGEANQAVSPTPEPDDDFEEILLDVFPDMELREFVELKKQGIIVREENNYHEYYGNCTYGMKKEIDLEKLYSYLKGLV